MCPHCAGVGWRRLGESPESYPDFCLRDDPVSGIRQYIPPERSACGQSCLVTPGLDPLRRIAAYAICRNQDDDVLLVRASQSAGTPGVWSLPGGAVDHGEKPTDTVVRETAAETGLSVAVTGLADVYADMRALPHRGVTIHTDRVFYRTRLRGGALADRLGQPTDLARWVPLAEAVELPLRQFTAVALG